MKREDEIKQAAENCVTSVCKDCFVIRLYHECNKKCIGYYEQANGFTKGAKWADEHPKSPWISTENELPTKGGHYLCMDENHHISTLAFCGNRWVNSSAFFDVSLEVVKYWMPIPNLPQE